MNGAMRKIVILVGSLSLLALPLVASADEGGGEEDPAPPDDSQLVYYYDSTVQVLLFGFFSPETDPEACTPVEPVTEGTTDDGGTTADDGETATELLECTDSLIIEGSVGKANHGSFLSLFTKEFKADFDGDKPWGHYVREFAKSDLGKTHKSDKAGKGSGDGEDADSDDGDGPDSDKDKGKGNGNNGNGHGKGKKGD